MLPEFEREHDGFLISTNQRRVDVEVVHEFLTHSYWAAGISRELVARSIENSLCFGIYRGDRQVGFARVISDYATFAYLADVFVLEESRGKGLSKFLMQCIVEHPSLQGLRRWVLGTRDAHGLYAQFGFKPLHSPEIFMEIHNRDVYRPSNS
ncbi:MAG TPA: GNAT family N-acetyltransferase [Terriglobales bacterium]|nr:GNAT family N-acetyltransferase [Terriglobales bacterium]